MRNFVFLSGEFEVTMPMVFRHSNWSHTQTAKKLRKNDRGLIHREGIDESILGVIYFNRTNDVNIERHNLNFIIENEVPCWPDPRYLLTVSSRHSTIRIVKRCKLIDHELYFVDSSKELKQLGFTYHPYVVKVGECHCGVDKFLIENDQQRDELNFEDEALIEPFFVGQSIRILTIGERVWRVVYDNATSWIKNSSGGSIVETKEITNEFSNVKSHAASVHELFGLQISGIDYVIDSEGNYHFLEFNQYPGMNVDDDVVDYARDFLSEKLAYVEKISQK